MYDLSKALVATTGMIVYNETAVNYFNEYTLI